MQPHAWGVLYASCWKKSFRETEMKQKTWNIVKFAIPILKTFRNFMINVRLTQSEVCRYVQGVLIYNVLV